MPNSQGRTLEYAQKYDRSSTCRSPKPKQTGTNFMFTRASDVVFFVRDYLRRTTERMRNMDLKEDERIIVVLTQGSLEFSFGGQALDHRKTVLSAKQKPQ